MPRVTDLCDRHAPYPQDQSGQVATGDAVSEASNGPSIKKTQNYGTEMRILRGARAEQVGNKPRQQSQGMLHNPKSTPGECSTGDPGPCAVYVFRCRRSASAPHPHNPCPLVVRNGMLTTRLATSVCQLRHDQMEQGPTESHAGRSTFLLSSGGAEGRVLMSGR